MELELLSKLTSGIREHDFNAGIAAAESRKTLKMITDSAGTVFDAWRKTKHGDFAGAARALGRVVHGNRKPQKMNAHDVSDAWLSMQYGWLPLMKNVWEGSLFIEKVMGPPRVIKTRYRRNVLVPEFDDSAPGWPELVPCTAKLSKEIRVQWIEALSTPRELGLLNPASVVWEVIPFSFVMDWFIPIGNYLDVLSVVPHIGNAQAATTLCKEVHGIPWHPYKCRSYIVPSERKIPHYDWACCWFVGTTPTTVLSSSGVANYHHKLITRTSLGTISVPRPSFKTVSEALSLGHLKNAAALMHSFTKR